MKRKSLIVFDLDGTLVKSKQPIDEEVIAAIRNVISAGFEVAIISGCKYEQMLDQLSVAGWRTRDLADFLLPTSGAQMYLTSSSRPIYKNVFTLKEKVIIFNTFQSAIILELVERPNLGYIVGGFWGEVAEDRDSQITFSLIGQEAPLKEKEDFNNKYNQIRVELAEIMRQHLLSIGYQVRLGGLTSIDVTKVGQDKAYGMNQLLDFTGYTKDEVLYFGDRLDKEGNDYPIKAIGIDCIEVKDPGKLPGQLGKILEELSKISE